MNRISMLKATLLTLTVVAGCGRVDDGNPTSQVQQPAELNADQQQQKTIALAARDVLFQKLLGKLMEAMSSSGPAQAIEVCREHAPAIASEVSQEYGVIIGRTSHQLRNPKNAPPDWAQALVDARTAEPHYVPLPDESLGALLPIRLKPQCLICHGPEEQILPDVRDALARSYPQDQATGFQEGELRGWFWVAVPAGARLPDASGAPEPPVSSTDVDVSSEG